MKLLLFAALSAALIAPAALAATPKLVGIDGPDTTLTLTKGGAKVSHLKAGAYTFVIKDKSSSHNFHLIGPGVNTKTSVAATGTTTWPLRLKKGTYRYICDPHASFMKGSFMVS